ncbi:MAG: MBL fold metallo-hydrolase, partial [Acidobacteria bacterium]|nr:MBL fold metallo-hydrolase [Acidobacteriota bacterium]
MKLAAVAVALFLAVSQAHRPDTLRIYVVDVEGGGATLVISPGGQSMLIDSGSPGAAAE